MNSLNISRPRVALVEPRIPQNTGTIGRSCLAFQSPGPTQMRR